MFIYTGGRRTGKTGKMIEWFLADPSNRVIVTPDVIQANGLIRRIEASMGADFPYYGHIFPYYEPYLQGTRNFEIGVENLDMILASVFSGHVAFATVTGIKFEAPVRKSRWKFW